MELVGRVQVELDRDGRVRRRRERARDVVEAAERLERTRDVLDRPRVLDSGVVLRVRERNRVHGRELGRHGPRRGGGSKSSSAAALCLQLTTRPVRSGHAMSTAALTFAPPSDRTREFRELVSAREAALPSTTKRPRVQFGKEKRAASLPPGAPVEDNWTKQAEQVVRARAERPPRATTRLTRAPARPRTCARSPRSCSRSAAPTSTSARRRRTTHHKRARSMHPRGSPRGRASGGSATASGTRSTSESRSLSEGP